MRYLAGLCGIVLLAGGCSGDTADAGGSTTVAPASSTTVAPPATTGATTTTAAQATTTSTNLAEGEATTSTTTTTTTTEPPELLGVEVVQIAELATPLVITAPVGDDRLFVAEREGMVRIVDADGRVGEEPFLNMTDTVGSLGVEQGLLGMAFHPSYKENGRFFVYYTDTNDDTVLAEYTVSDDPSVADGESAREVMFFNQPTERHNGGMVEFGPDGYLYVAVGDGGDGGHNGQKTDTLFGTIVRIDVDGGDPYAVPDDNPFIGNDRARPEIYSYGHRNIQGATLHPQSGRLWTHEHGPQGGDEINLPEPAVNYGWPVITYGVNYGIGTAIGEGTEKPGMAQPLYYWVPSIAPSGMSFYDGDAFPDWRGNLFVGSLKFRLLVRLEIAAGKVVHEERMLQGTLGRIRDVRQGPDGLLYLLTDADDGLLVRLRPAE